MKKLKTAFIILLGVICCCLTAAACAQGGQLSAPQNLHIEGETILVWDEVENADGYVIYFNKTEYEIRENRYDLSALPENQRFKIEVLAFSYNFKFKASDWSVFEYIYREIIPTEGLEYKLLPDGKGYEVNADYFAARGEVVIPDTYNGLPIKKIGDGAFDTAFGVHKYDRDPQTGKNCNALKSVRLPAGLEEIGNEAFTHCIILTEIDIPKSVKIIGDNAFTNCIKLKRVSLPEMLESIGDNAFKGCAFGEITIPPKVENIGKGAFQGCAFKEITIPSKVSIIDYNTFADCKNLIKIIIPDSVTAINIGAFDNCYNLSEISFPKKLESFSRSAIDDTAWYKNQPQGFIVLNGSLLIGYNGDIPEGGVIDGLPKGVTQIGNGAFQRSEVVSITVSEGVSEIGNNAFKGCGKLTEIALPSTLKTIGEYAFGACNSLQSITIPEGVTEIKNETFFVSKNLTEIILPSTLKTIGVEAFGGCASLQSISIPEGVTEIKSGAFAKCVNLKKIVLPSTLKILGFTPVLLKSGVFSQCSSLQTVFYSGSRQDWDKVAIDEGTFPEPAPTVYFYADNAEPAPDDGGNYWSFASDGKTPVIIK